MERTTKKKLYKTFYKLRALLLCLGLFACDTASLRAQDTTCDANDIAWVSATVNADVGLAAGSGRCATNTVVGANYNDPLVPFGVQAALDCACNDSIIAILGDTGDYGSGTASWNNRFDATKSINQTTINPYIRIYGYATSADPCIDDNNAAGCPVTMNFSGNTDRGWELTGNNGYMAGILVENAATTGVYAVGSTHVLAGMVIRNNGGWGVELQTGINFYSSIVRSEISGNGGSVANTGGVHLLFRSGALYNYIHDNTGAGIQKGNAETRALYNIIQDTVGDGIRLNHRQGFWYGNTVRGSTDAGVDVLPSGVSSATYNNFFVLNIFADNGGYGINSARHSSKAAGGLMYNIFSGNASGAINPTNMPAFSWPVKYGNDEAATVVFTSATDSNVVSGAEIVLTYPGGNTPLTINAGAIPDGGSGSGGGGVYRSVGSR